jgi:hypothetical protein
MMAVAATEGAPNRVRRLFEIEIQKMHLLVVPAF